MTPALSTATSRRTFTRLLAAGAALAVRPPAFADPAVAPATAATPTVEAPRATPQAAPAVAPSPTIVRLSANENPYGPPPAAFGAMRAAFGQSCRYPDDEADELCATLAKLHGVAPEQILLGDGSSQILQLAAAAFTGPAAPVVTADPTLEAVGRHAAVQGAKVKRVPLTADYRHDLPAMAAAAGTAGLVYVCNPNNPTASITPATELAAFLDRLPPNVVVLVDEAYHHYAEGTPGYKSALPWLAAQPNLVVVRTFSKIFGLAGLRCGYAVAQPERIKALAAHQPFDSINVMALVAARAALGGREHLERSRQLNHDVREWTRKAVEEAGHPVVPSAANFFMADLGRDVAPVIAALKEQGVAVGRRFPALPGHLRVTVGTAEEMQAFVAAFRRVVS